MLPVEVGLPSPRITFYDYDKNEDQKLVDLDLLPETRGNALLKSIVYKQKITRYFNKRVLPRAIEKGDWVLRKLGSTGKTPTLGKLQPNWDGPFKITEVIRPGTYRLADENGKALPRPTDNFSTFLSHFIIIFQRCN